MTDKELLQEALDVLEVAPYMSNKDDYDFHQKFINALRVRLAQPEPTNRFNPDWDALPVMVEEQQRMAKRIEELETQLGEAMWGYGEWRRKAEALEWRRKAKALEEEKQEPVAWISCNAGLYHGKPDESLKPLPLYTTPPQREWVGLTDEELLDIADMAYTDDLELLQTLQAKLKEKNT